MGFGFRELGIIERTSPCLQDSYIPKPRNSTIELERHGFVGDIDVGFLDFEATRDETSSDSQFLMVRLRKVKLF